MKTVVENWLCKLLECDHVIIFQSGPKVKRDRFLRQWEETVRSGFGETVATKLQQWTSKHSMLWGFEVKPGSGDSDLPQDNIVVGPDADDAKSVESFHALWRKENCELRRFQDGRIRESVYLENPHGPAYFVIAKLIFLFSLHLEQGVHVQVQRLPSSLVELCFKASERRDRIRAITHNFVQLVKDVAHATRLPVRQVRAICDCMYSGAQHHHNVEQAVEKSVSQTGVHLRKNVAFLSEKLDAPVPEHVAPIRVLLEITAKEFLSAKLFARMKMSYINELMTALKPHATGLISRGSRLYIIYQSTLFWIDVQDPNSVACGLDKDNIWRTGSLYEFLHSIGASQPAWAGVTLLVRQWLVNVGLGLNISGYLLDMVLAVLYQAPLRVNDHISLPALDVTSSVEKAFLRFLYLLAFTNLSTCVLELRATDSDEESKNVKLCESRASLPHMAIVTPFDGTVPSLHTRSLDRLHVIRLVNCAKQALFCFTSSFPDISYYLLMSEISKLDEDSFDLVIHLKTPPDQIAAVSQSSHNQRNGEPRYKKCKTTEHIFPVVDYDPVRSFLVEAKECFGNHASFYEYRSLQKIGVKVRESQIPDSEDSMPSHVPFDLNLLTEDLKVLGQGLVSDVRLCRKL